MSRASVEQRCSCQSCGTEGRHTGATRATCGACGAWLLLLHWADITALAFGTCPVCDQHGGFTLAASETDMSAMEEQMAHA